MEPRRIDIKAGYACNNNCRFCIIGTARRGHNRTTSQIINEIKKAKENNYKKVVLTGGEITIRQDFLTLVKFAKSIGTEMIHIESNGRMFSNQDFTKKTIESGATHFTISFHASNKDDYEFITNTSKDAYDQVIQGLKNLKKYTENIGVNCTITRVNYDKLDKIIDVCKEIGIKNVNFPFVNPAGNAWINKDEILISMSEAIPYLHSAIEHAMENSILCTTEMIPLCFMQGYESGVVELMKKDMSVSAVEYIDENFVKTRKRGKIKSRECTKCIKDNLCEGFLESYSSIYGDKEFQPVR